MSEFRYRAASKPGEGVGLPRSTRWRAARGLGAPSSGVVPDPHRHARRWPRPRQLGWKGEGAETSVLFELIGARYENRSVLVIANEPFSAEGKIFGSDAMAVAAVDRLVHRSHIFERNGDSYRCRAAAEARQAAAGKQGGKEHGETPEPA